MYTYKNKVTGVTVTTFGKVTGANWVQVKDPKNKDTKAKAANAAEDDEKESDGE